MKIERKFTDAGKNVYEKFEYITRSSILRNADGSVVFEMHDIEVPTHWSQIATDILAQKYFRKAGVPQKDSEKLGSETSVKQVVHRLAGTWVYWGKCYGYFDSEADAEAFYDEAVFMLLNQMVAPNSPQWFNTGLHYSYGITGAPQGHYYVSQDDGNTYKSADAFSRPQTSACFIQSIDDDLVNEGGIFDLLSKEARIFKYGSGTGTNFSNLRAASEKLSGGGVSSGLMSFLKIFDRAAGAIKSGGTTRRAAKMVTLDIDHPDVEDFIEWKAKEEDKVAALVSGSKIYAVFMQAIIDSAVKGGTDVNKNKELKKLVQKALNRGLPLNAVNKTLDLIASGFTNLDFIPLDTKFEGEAYNTVSGQNSNNSVRVTNDFMQAVEDDADWELKYRRSGEVAKVVKARSLFNKINVCAWESADPGLQYDTTINEWNTCPKSGRINASNPCSEYMFLDDSACNLASINLIKFYDKESGVFKVDDYKYAIKIWTLVLELSIVMTQYPSKKIAELSYEFRTLGLGYANIGTLLMISGIPYDSKEALAIVGALTSLLTSEAYTTSALIAKEQGPFKHYETNRKDMLRVIRNHRNAAYNGILGEYESLTITPQGIDENYCPKYLLASARKSWDKALEYGMKYGFRNAQVTVLAPTGTIALLMDCDTTGIEPDFALVKYKKLSGGGYFKIVNQSVKIALHKLGYTETEIEDIEKYMLGNSSFIGCPYINRETLLDKGFTDAIVDVLERKLSDAFDIRFIFNKYNIGDEFLLKLGFMQADIDGDMDLLSLLGYSEDEILAANDFICGTLTLEGAPHLKDEHLPIFDCASKCGKNGKRFIEYMAHIRIMAAAQPFITGAISKTVNMPSDASVGDVDNVYLTSWKMMLKAIAIYRDGSKLSQPLNSSSYEGLDEVVTLGDENTLDETLGPRDIHNLQERKLIRRRLPKKRIGITREVSISGQKIYLRTGEYEDGTLGEIFIDIFKEGAAFRSMLNSFAILTSKALQYGIPLEELVDTFANTKFDPHGVVQGHEAIKMSSSVLDYIFRTLGFDYLGRTDLVNVKNITPNVLQKMEQQVSNNPQIQTAQKSESKIMDVVDKVLAEVETIDKDALPLPLVATDDIKRAKSMGYTGEQCANCFSIRVKRNGSCMVCEDCGQTTGCS